MRGAAEGKLAQAVSAPLVRHVDFLSLRFWRCWYLGILQIPIKCLQHEESSLLFSVIAHQPFAIEVILNTGQCSPWTTEVLEDPWRGPAKKRDALQHRDLMPIKILLILLGPTCAGGAVEAEESVPATFAHDEWLVVF